MELDENRIDLLGEGLKETGKGMMGCGCFLILILFVFGWSGCIMAIFSK